MAGLNGALCYNTKTLNTNIKWVNKFDQGFSPKPKVLKTHRLHQEAKYKILDAANT